MTLAYRTQGLILAAGNPKSIKQILDIARSVVKFVNRNSRSGTRLWFDMELKKRKIDPAQIKGYGFHVRNHSEAAALVAQKKADVSIGLQAAAHQLNLDFIPLFEERYDLVLPARSEKMLAPFLDFIQTGAFRSLTSAMTGYNTAHSGELIPL